MSDHKVAATFHPGKQLAKQEDGNLPRTYVPAATRVSEPDLSAFPDQGANGLGPCGCGQHACGQWHRAVAAELVACTLGARSRPELVPALEEFRRSEWAG